MGKPHKILLVDDEPYNNRVLKLKFENAGYEIISASNGLDGLNKFRTTYPDIVITDIKMPVMDGREMCTSLNESGNERQFLIIVVTSTVERSERSWINDIGNAILVEKPMSPSHLLSIVEDYFKKVVTSSCYGREQTLK